MNDEPTAPPSTGDDAPAVDDDHPADRGGHDRAEASADDEGFAEFGLRASLLESLRALGYEEPTPIQREAIPLLLAGHDLVGRAATGTGKTAAFALPIIEQVADVAATRGAGPSGNRSTPVVALVLAPTRELAMQVSEAFYKYGHSSGVSVLPVYGGQHIGRQLDALRRGVNVVVATPGRALDHVRRGSLDLSTVRTVVLDEADEMLDMGFADDIEALLDAVPAERQTVLFSATMPPRIDAIARRHQHDPVVVHVTAAPTDARDAPLVEQRVYVVRRAHKAAALGRILDVEAPDATLVFCRTRGEVDQLTETMNGRGYRAEALHGGMSQEQRDRVMGRLRAGTAELLVATDVAARGLDVDLLTHVVNYDVPSAPEAYVHRIGRVGRAGRRGVAITLAEPRELRLLANIERLTKHKIGTETVPTVADLRASQVESTARAIAAAADTTHGDDDAHGDADLREILDGLCAERELVDVALGAIRLVHQAHGALDDEFDIPDATPSSTDRRGRGDGRRERSPERSGGGERRELSATTTTARVYIGAGRNQKVRPQDLVGAIANETRLTGRQIGAIRVADQYSVVEVPEAAVDEVIAAMSTAMLRGKRVTARRYTDHRR